MMKMLRISAAAAGLALIFILGMHTPASAQQMTSCGYWSDGTWVATPCGAPDESYQSSPCGYWSQGLWVSTPCGPRPQRAAVSGTIVGIDSSMLTLQVGPTQTVLVNDGPALNRMDTGRIYRGRVITAYGYWDGDQFVATSIA
jgi:hypothetical protein